MSAESVCFHSLHVLPVCVAAGWCPCWRCCQPEQQPRRSSQRQFHIQHRTQPPSGNIQRFEAHCSLFMWLTQYDVDIDHFIFKSYLYVYIAFNRSYFCPGCPGACHPGAEGGEAGQGWDAREPLHRQVRWWEWQKRYEDTQGRHSHKVRTCKMTNTKYFPKVKKFNSLTDVWFQQITLVFSKVVNSAVGTNRGKGLSSSLRLRLSWG